MQLGNEYYKLIFSQYAKAPLLHKTTLILFRFCRIFKIALPTVSFIERVVTKRHFKYFRFCETSMLLGFPD